MKNATWKSILQAALLTVTVCALPALAGPDTYGLGTHRSGALTVDTTGLVINTYAQVTAPLSRGDTTILVGNATGLAANDLVLVIQMTGIVPEPPSGGPTPVDLTNDPVGRWELARLTGVAGTTLTLDVPLVHSYAANVTQVVHVPEYSTVLINATRNITAPAWNGSTGGVVAFLAEGTVTNNAFPGIVVTGKGFRGGTSVNDSSGSTGCADAVQSVVSNTNAFTVDAVPPAAPVVLTPAPGSVTSNNTPTYTGTAEAGSTVQVYVDDVPVGTTTADANGNWTRSHPSALADGSHLVKATAADALGNVSAFSNRNTFTVDTTAPAAPVVSTPANGALLGDNTPTYSGTAEASSTVTVDGVSVGIATADASGNWALSPSDGLTNGSHTVRVTATDAAGNTSSNSKTHTFTVDTTVPTAPVVTGPADNTVTNDSTPTITGTADANTTVTVTLNGTAVGTPLVDAAGHWTFTPTTPLPDGLYSLTAVSTNAAGNASQPSNTVHFTVDTAVAGPSPSVPVGCEGCTSARGAPSALAMMGLAVLGALVARRRRA